MRIIKDRIKKEVSQYEINCIAYESRKKLLAAGSYQEPVLVFKYPYLKLFKKIIHRERIPLTEQDILKITDDNNVFEDENGNKFSKGQILSAEHLIFTPSGDELFIAFENGDILVYNAQTWKRTWSYKFSARIGSIQIVNGGKTLFISTKDWNLIEIDMDGWKVKNQKVLSEKNKGIAVAKDDLSQIFVILDKKRIGTFDYETLNEINVFKGHTRGINKIILSPSEKLLASSGMDGNICVYDIQTGEMLSHLIGHADEVHEIIFIADDKFILSSSEDERLILWNLKNYKNIHSFPRIPNALSMGLYRNLIVMGNVKGEIRTFKTV